MGSPSQNTSINNCGCPLLEHAGAEDAPNPSGLCASLPTVDQAPGCQRSNAEADMQEADPLLGLASLPAGPAGRSDMEWSGSEADDKEIEPCISNLRSNWLGPAGPSCPYCASSHFDLSTFPSHLCKGILSKLPVEQQIKWSLVCKTWKELFLKMRGRNAQPSTKNRPILVSGNSLPRPQVVATYSNTLNIWHSDYVMGSFMRSRPAAHKRHRDLSSIATSGGLIYRFCSNELGYISTIIEIYNPITDEYKRLELQQDARADRVQDRWGRDRSFLVWGITVENHLNRYQVIVQKWRVSGGATISQLLVYHSPADLWETVGPLPQSISGRIGNHIYSSTSSGGNLYFLTRGVAAGLHARKRPRLIKYDSKEKRIREIVPVPNFVGRGEPMLLEYNGDIIFVTTKRIQQRYEQRTTWVFFRLDCNSDLFAQMKVMPLDQLRTLRGKIKTEVGCHGNGDRVYFWGKPSSESRIMSVLVHDFVRNSWTWLPDFPFPENTSFWRLMCLTPSFMKA